MVAEGGFLFFLTATGARNYDCMRNSSHFKIKVLIFMGPEESCSWSQCM